jgi:signal transduction histidine kinase
VFAACLLLVLGGVAWISVAALDLDRAEAEALRRAALEENVRLGLWRMDSAIAPIIAREGARPYFVFNAFYPAERAFSEMWQTPGPRERMLASPLLRDRPEPILLHFQLGSDGAVTSPEVPEGRQRELALQRGETTEAKLDVDRGRLAQLSSGLDRGQLLALLSHPRSPGVVETPMKPKTRPQDQVQASKSSLEWFARSRSVQQSLNSYNPKNAAPEQDKLEADVAAAPLEAEGAMTPLWVGERLLLVRRIQAGTSDLIQGCWVDWKRLEGSLLTDLADLLPGAELEPIPGAPRVPGSEDRMLASIPVRLVPKPPLVPPAVASPRLMLVLGAAWSAMAIAAAAVAFLLVGTIALSERRADFVSAVTHELRTPLTTFRMYTEMLVGGMVQDDDRRSEYLDTLRREAVRLSHLVENVLSYARIERGRGPSRSEVIDLAGLIERSKERLADRAAQAGMKIETTVPSGTTALAEPGALEQILFNLVDNACKYAASATDRRIHVLVEPRTNDLCLWVFDHGPGIPPADRRRLFRPFSKSAQRAANSAPGVGLGLALSRRLARAMGGELSLQDRTGAGASFLLTLRRAS